MKRTFLTLTCSLTTLITFAETAPVYTADVDATTRTHYYRVSVVSAPDERSDNYYEVIKMIAERDGHGSSTHYARVLVDNKTEFFYTTDYNKALQLQQDLLRFDCVLTIHEYVNFRLVWARATVNS